jgi:serine protease Do
MVDEPGPPKPADPRREQFRRQVEQNKRRQQMLERIWKEAQRHQPSAQERNHASVKQAFREVVAPVRNSTVRVLADGKQVALGVIVRPDGLVATKGSEAQGKLEIELSDGRRLAAKQVATDETNDLALLRVNAAGLPAAALSSAAPLAVGGWLATCGQGVDPVAVGVVSVAAREIRPPRGILGVLLSEGGGAQIEEIMPGSAAEEAGLQVADKVVEMDGKKISTTEQLRNMLRRKQAGDKVRLTIARAEEKIDMEITLGTEEMSGMRADRFQMMNLLGGPLSTRRAGFRTAFQHDTILAPNDCGGPVVDLEGRIVGLNIARAGRVDSYAIPAAVVEQLVHSQPAAAATPEPVTRKEPTE